MVLILCEDVDESARLRTDFFYHQTVVLEKSGIKLRRMTIIEDEKQKIEIRKEISVD
jgi:hypothetical protein